MIKSKQNNEKYRRFREYRRSLPAWNVGGDILAALQDHQVVVIVGETGCGKSTQVGFFDITHPKKNFNEKIKIIYE